MSCQREMRRSANDLARSPSSALQLIAGLRQIQGFYPDGASLDALSAQTKAGVDRRRV